MELKMKKKASFFVVAGLILFSLTAKAEETQKPAETPVAAVATATPEPVATPVVTSTPAVVEAPVAAPTTAQTAPAPVEANVATPAEASMTEKPKETEVGENLEFVSGEISAADAAAKTITVKLYGETENEPKEKSIVVNVDETTDITDGEKDRDFKSLASGTEVDVEYDPTSNKATYIFVY